MLLSNSVTLLNVHASDNIASYNLLCMMYKGTVHDGRNAWCKKLIALLATILVQWFKHTLPKYI